MKKAARELLFIRASEELKHYKKISASLLQRKLAISYYQGLRLLHKLYKKGYGEYEKTSDGKLLVYKN